MNIKESVMVLKTLDFTLLLGIALGNRKQEAFRAACTLEYMLINDPEKFNRQVPAFFAALAVVDNPSVMHHFSKIVALLTAQMDKQPLKALLEPIPKEPIIELLFTWLINRNLPVAIKVHSMQALANLSKTNDWIANELLETIDFQEKYESPAFFARAKHIRKQLKK